jgi:putative ABC transport system permease protein
MNMPSPLIKFFMFTHRLRAWLTPRQQDYDFAQELKTHLDLLIQENLRRGMTPADAERSARISLGGATQLQETHREQRGLPMLETLIQDTRYALRTLRKNPGFTALTVLTLALGIGANTAIFSIVYAVLLKPLPYPNSQQLFNIFQVQRQEGVAATGFSFANFAELRQQSKSFSEMAGSQRHELTLTGHGDPTVVKTSVVTPELFELMGQTPVIGRIFTPQDGQPGAAPVTLLSEHLWRAMFAADPKIIGTSINLDKRRFTVVGIVTAKFRFPQINQSEQLWIPLVNDPLFGSWIPNRGGHWLQITGRLRPGASLPQAQAELDAIAARLGQEFPEENSGWTIGLLPLRQLFVFNVSSALWILLGAVALVLLISCANIANLLLARATSRSREMAVRTTLGAARSRIVRQLLTETAVLGAFGGLSGVALAYWGVQVLRSVMPSTVPQVSEIRVDTWVFLFAILLSAAATCIFGLVPALFTANANVQSSLREGGARAGESRNRRTARSVLAAAEISLALVLLLAAGLMLRSFAKLTAMSPGFVTKHIVKGEVSLPQFQYTTPQQWMAFSDELLARLQGQPGLQQTAMAVPAPIADGFVNLGFDIVGHPQDSAGTSRTADYATISPNYFQVLGIPLLAGRAFDLHDAMSAPRVAIISQAMAHVYFPNEDPLGKQLRFGLPPDSGAAREIVGIVADVRDVAIGQDPGPMMYVPYAQSPFWGAVVLVKSENSTTAVSAAIRREVTSIDKDLPVTDIAQMPDVIDSSMAQSRFGALLLTLFAAVALILAATGIFGVISYSVACRTNEIGVRVALGASRPAILRMVSKETLVVTAAGLAVGIPCALAAARLLGHMLVGVSASDPLTLIAVALALAAAAALASYLPARRATQVDPIIALRHE